MQVGEVVGEEVVVTLWGRRQAGATSAVTPKGQKSLPRSCLGLVRGTVGMEMGGG